MSVSWEVTFFAVQTTRVDQVSDQLFANGNMQVPVIVTIGAINPTTWATHQLTDAELQRIQLVDYYSGAVLTGTWFYSLTPNDFAHTLGGTIEAIEPTSDAPQSIRLYVSSTRIENKVIGARITQPNNTVVTTNGTNFNSLVTLTGIHPVIYNTSNITLGDKKKITTGNWTYTESIAPNTWHETRNWQQENYYVTSEVHPILKADLHDYRTGTTLTNSFYLQFNNFDLDIFYFWNPGPETSKSVGVRHQTTVVESGKRFGPPITVYVTTRDARATVRVNQHRSEFCLTHMTFFHNRNWEMAPWSEDAWVRLYDVFGNYGDFYVKVKETEEEDEEDEKKKSKEYTLYLENKNSANSTESISSSSKAKL